MMLILRVNGLKEVTYLTNLQLGENVTNYLDPHSFELFLAQLPNYPFIRLMTAHDWYVLFRVLYGCGLRVSEALSLRKEDFELDTQQLVIQHAKTSKKKCPKCTRIKKDGFKKTQVIILDDCPKCNNQRFIIKAQRTTILKKDVFMLQDYFKMINRDIVFPTTRQTVWIVSKELARLAGLHLFEQQDERAITGAWTHLFRKSRAKLMSDKGATRAMIQLKLRHAHKEAIDTYLKVDINALRKWENENL